MKQPPHDPRRQRKARESLKDELYVRLAGLEGPQLELVLEFLEQVVARHDPEVIETFLQWQRDPMISSILQIASVLSAELREQLLFEAEDLYSSESPRH